jgi:hypothetical protein
MAVKVLLPPTWLFGGRLQLERRRLDLTTPSYHVLVFRIGELHMHRLRMLTFYSYPILHL